MSEEKRQPQSEAEAKRRGFLKTAGKAALAAPAVTLLLSAANRAQAQAVSGGDTGNPGVQ